MRHEVEFDLAEKWQNASVEDILNRRPTKLVVGPSVTVDLIRQRLLKFAEICGQSLKGGAASLSEVSRNKLRVCQGTMLLDMTAVDQFVRGVPVGWGGYDLPIDRRSDSLQKERLVRITLSVEWDGLLVLKRCNAISGKSILLVYPLAYGVSGHSARAGEAHSAGKELAVGLRKLTPMRADRNASLSASSANLARAWENSLLLRIDLGSHKKVEKALEVLRYAEQRALTMVLRPPPEHQERNTIREI